MKVTPLLFNGPMVCALLDGRKTQTRRIVHADIVADMGSDASRVLYRCPFGQTGDLIWVRETCRAHELTDQEAREDTFGVMDRLGLEAPLYCLDGVIYHADNAFREIQNTIEASEDWLELNSYRGERGAIVPSIHMPRWASRLTLRLTDVRVERANDISAEDAIKEGIATVSKDGGRTWKYGIPDRDGLPGTDDHGWPWKNWQATPHEAFMRLFYDVSGRVERSENPLVWALSFEVIHKNIDDVLKEG